MGLYASFDIVDDFGFIEATKEYGIIPDYSEGCEAFVETFLSVARELVPVDTGFLRSSISADTDGFSFCECEAFAEYAQYVEYGTWKMRAQPYFEPALEMALATAEPYWIQAEEDALLEEEMLLEEEEEQQAMQQGRAGGRQQGGMSLGGSILGMLITLAVVAVFTIVQEFFRDIFGDRGGGSSRRGSVGEGTVYLPEIIIT